MEQRKTQNNLKPLEKMQKINLHKINILNFVSQKFYLVQGGLLADKDEEDEASAEEVDAPDRPQNKLGGWEAFRVRMVAMRKVVGTLKDPRDAHNNE